VRKSLDLFVLSFVGRSRHFGVEAMRLVVPNRMYRYRADKKSLEKVSFGSFSPGDADDWMRS